MKPVSLAHLLIAAIIGFAVPGFVAVGTVLSLGERPSVSIDTIEPEVEATATKAAKPIYQKLLNPVVVTLASGQTLALDVALVLEPETPSSVQVVLENGMSALTADLATSVQDALGITPNPFTWSAVAAPALQSMRTALNTALDQDDLPPYVREVLVLKAIHSETATLEK